MEELWWHASLAIKGDLLVDENTEKMPSKDNYIWSYASFKLLIKIKSHCIESTLFIVMEIPLEMLQLKSLYPKFCFLWVLKIFIALILIILQPKFHLLIVDKYLVLHLMSCWLLQFFPLWQHLIIVWIVKNTTVIQ